MRKAECATQKLLLACFLSVSAIVASAFGSDFKPAEAGYTFEFPRDHGSHEEYRTEWWYYTGHLRTDGGKRYGFEVTFFRVGLATPEEPVATQWDVRNLALAHFAITDISGRKFRYYEKLNRQSPFTANALTGRLEVFNEGWSATTQADGSWRLIASDGGDTIDLVLRAVKPPAVHGENGISVKAEGAGYASHYYSMTRLEVTGTIRASGGPASRCSGLAWMDHEFGSSVLRENQQGWDWFAIQLDNETELMLYQIRRSGGGADVTSSGSLITDRGEVIHIRADQMRITPLSSWKSRVSGATYPMGWRVSVPALKIALTVKPLLEDQELVTRRSTQITYWEGAVDVSGSFGNIGVFGSGYVEMTGYDRKFSMKGSK